MSLAGLFIDTTGPDMYDTKRMAIKIKDDKLYFYASSANLSKPIAEEISFTVLDKLTQMAITGGAYDTQEWNEKFTSADELFIQRYILLWHDGKKTGPGEAKDDILNYIHELFDKFDPAKKTFVMPSLSEVPPGEWTCSFCGHKNPDYKFCSECGSCKANKPMHDNNIILKKFYYSVSGMATNDYTSLSIETIDDKIYYRANIGKTSTKIIVEVPVNVIEELTKIALEGKAYGSPKWVNTSQIHDLMLSYDLYWKDGTITGPGNSKNEMRNYMFELLNQYNKT